MRVTNSMLVSGFLNNLNNNMGKLGRLQGQLAANRKYTHISDDPVSVIYSQQARQKLHTLAQYQTNVELGQSWLTQAETSVMELNNLIQSAYERTIDAATSAKGPQERAATGQYIGELRDQVMSLLNSTFGDKYVFGGYNTTGYVKDGELVAPFGYVDELDAGGNPTGLRRLTYNGLDVESPVPPLPSPNPMEDALIFDIGPGITLEVSNNGVGLMNFDTQNNGANEAQCIYNLFDRLRYALETNAPVGELQNNFIKPLQDAQSHVLTVVADIGGRTSRLELIASRYEQDALNYTQMKSDAEDADQAELIMQYKMAESVYKAALATGSYIIQPSLMDFLR